jgi:2-amino-4-hydroxy-6-hydroxymethyldihydropteridine diphosphokinase
MIAPDAAARDGEPTAPRQIVLSLGSNIGDRLGYLQAGIDGLQSAPDHIPGHDEQAGSSVLATAVSAVYDTAPVGGPEQPSYLNAVLLATSALPARSILRRCQAIELACGRTRVQRWGPRTLDIDIIARDGEISDDPELTLPHPRAYERAFVLAPWLDVDPAAVLPGYGPVASLLAEAGTQGVTRLTGPRLRIDRPGLPRQATDSRGDAD